MQVNFEDALDISGNLKNSEQLNRLNEPKYSRCVKERYLCYQSSCKYQDKSKSSLKLHEKSHKDYNDKISCEYCSFHTKRKHKYIRHLVSDHPEIRLNVIEQCDWPACFFASHISGSLAKHMKTHQTLSCNQCVFTTDKSLILSKHVNQQHRKRSYICDTCGKALLSADNLRIHNNKRHKKTKLQCNICPHRTIHLQTHYNRTHGHKMLCCKYCDFKTSYPNLLKSHLNKIHLETPNKTTVHTNIVSENILIEDQGPQLNQEFISDSTVTSHINHNIKHREGNDTNILTKLKSETVLDERHFQQHPVKESYKEIKFISQESKPHDILSSLNTPGIGNELKTESRLYIAVKNSLEGVLVQKTVLIDSFEEHDTKIPYVASEEQLNHIDNVGKEEISQITSDRELYSKSKDLFYCDMPMCTYKGKTKDLLKSHLSRHIKTQDDLYTCSYCGNAFNQKQTLKSHEKSKHSNIEYTCEKCPYKGYNIQDHLRRRHGKKSYLCKLCDYKSNRSRELHCHMISKHSISAEKRKSGSRINLLATKLHSSDGIQMYKCKTCPYTTDGPSNIYKHDITHRFPERKRNIIKF